ncbi:hypothetical protein ACWC4D_03540 [Streptomyces sp. NPDC001288]|uniref:hypothetical protein n=1 Tax=unclassified Streptomyces TaxID=2593676 RepID=UPI0033330BD7
MVFWIVVVGVGILAWVLSRRRVVVTVVAMLVAAALFYVFGAPASVSVTSGAGKISAAH